VLGVGIAAAVDAVAGLICATFLLRVPLLLLLHWPHLGGRAGVPQTR
jgi:hypothetical protein